MTAGLPSAGIGGLFYLIGALAMPFKELVAAVRQPSAPRHWRFAMRQAAIAIGIISALWVTGLGLGYIIGPSSTHTDVFGRLRVVSGSTNMIRFITFAMSFGLLTAVLSVVQIARLVVGRQTRVVEHRSSQARRAAAMLLCGALALSAPRALAQTHSQTSSQAGSTRVIIAPHFGGAGDSDGNRLYRAGVDIAATIGDGTRALIGAEARRVNGGQGMGPRATVAVATLGIAARPAPAVRVEGSAGVGVIGDSIDQRSAQFLGALRLRLRLPAGRGVIDTRVSRQLIDVTPQLVTNRVVRNEVGSRIDLKIAGPVGIRGVGRLASIHAVTEQNTRTMWGGGPIVHVTPSIELAGAYQEIRYTRPSAAGYFSPERVKVAEVGSYAEFESESGRLLAFDAGAGGQRITEFGSVAGHWRPTLRVWSQLTAPMTHHLALLLEVEGYTGALGSAVTPSSEWRYGSATLGIRVGL